MKKTLVSALTTALVVGAASTTFAAANPFADVPADHWAYDAVSELQAKGVVNGYAVDNTFRGNQNMTRYEMAQIVAKAMAKVETGDAATKAMVDKLAAEFRDELANLGVRMDDLEARMDNVKHSGFIRYRYSKTGGSYVHEDQGVRGGAPLYEHVKNDDHFLRFRLNSAVKINDKVDGYARLEWNHNIDTHQSDNRGVTLQRLWVHGTVGTTEIYAGRINFNDKVTSLGHGLMLDTEADGVQVTFNKDNLSWTIDAGKAYSGNYFDVDWDDTARYDLRTIGTHVDYKNGNFDAAIGYYNFGNGVGGFRNGTAIENKKTYGAWGVGLGYKFGPDFYLTADYARSSAEALGLEGEGVGKDAYNFQLNYKGAQESVPHSWGAFVGYHKLTPYAAPAPTYDAKANLNYTGYAYAPEKGWKIGVDYTFMKNITGSLQYFDGTIIGAGEKDKARRFFGQLTFGF